MRRAYKRLHRLGYAHSAEAWRGDRLAGGLYGVSLGGAFFGESMFARAPDASKAAFVTLVRQLRRWGIALIDCQVATEHLERFGAREWPRERFLAALAEALERPTRGAAGAPRRPPTPATHRRRAREAGRRGRRGAVRDDPPGRELLLVGQRRVRRAGRRQPLVRQRRRPAAAAAPAAGSTARPSPR